MCFFAHEYLFVLSSSEFFEKFCCFFWIAWIENSFDFNSILDNYFSVSDFYSVTRIYPSFPCIKRSLSISSFLYNRIKNCLTRYIERSCFWFEFFCITLSYSCSFCSSHTSCCCSCSLSCFFSFISNMFPHLLYLSSSCFNCRLRL